MEKSTTQGPVADLVMLSPDLGLSPDAGHIRRAVSPPIDLSKEDVTALYERANALRENGQLDEAIAAYSRAHDLEPGSSEILNNLGDAFRARGRIGEAILACRSAILLRPDFAEAHNNLGNALRDQGKYDEAIDAYTKAAQLRPEVHSIHNNLGIVLSIQGRLDEAMVSYATAIRLKPDYAKAHNNLGSVLRDKGRPDEAVRSCQRAIELKPDFAQAYNNLGVALASMGRFGDAVGAYNRALELQPQLAGVHQHLADAYRQTGQLANAITAYRRAIQLKPTHGMLYCNLGHALKDSGRIDEAIGAYVDSIRLKPDSVEPYFNLGNALRDKGQYEQAADVYREALKRRPDLATIHNHLGVVLNLCGKVNEAIDAFTGAVRLKPDYAKAYNNLGAALRDQGRFEEAIIACHRATILKPDYAMGHYNLGKALKDVGRLDDAIAAYLTAIRLQPNLAEAYNNLGNAYKERGQLEEAIAAYARAVELKPNLAQARFNLDYARLEQTRSEKRLRGEIDVYELQPSPVDRHEEHPLPSEEGAPVEEVGPRGELMSAQEILPVEESAPSAPSLPDKVGPELDRAEQVEDDEQSTTGDLALGPAILFEPPEARIVEGSAIDDLPSHFGPLDDPRNTLMADVSDVFVPPALAVQAEPGEIELLTFVEEPDERPSPPVSTLPDATDADRVGQLGSLFPAAEYDESIDRARSDPESVFIENPLAGHSTALPEPTLATEAVSDSPDIGGVNSVTVPAEAIRESIGDLSQVQSSLTSDPFSADPITAPQPSSTLDRKSRLSRLMNFPSWVFGSLLSGHATVEPTTAAATFAVCGDVASPPKLVAVPLQSDDSLMVDATVIEPVRPIESTSGLESAAFSTETIPVASDSDVLVGAGPRPAERRLLPEPGLAQEPVTDSSDVIESASASDASPSAVPDAMKQSAAENETENDLVIATVDSAVVPVDEEAVIQSVDLIDSAEPSDETQAPLDLTPNPDNFVEATTEHKTEACEAGVESANVESESAGASLAGIDAGATPSGGIDIALDADISITDNAPVVEPTSLPETNVVQEPATSSLEVIESVGEPEPSSSVVRDAIEQSTADHGSENNQLMLTADTAATSVDAEVANSVVETINAAEPIEEAQTALDTPASLDKPVEVTAANATAASEPVIESAGAESESAGESLVGNDAAATASEGIDVGSNVEGSISADAPAAELPPLPEPDLIQETATNTPEAVEAADASLSVTPDAMEESAGDHRSESDLVTLTVDSAAVFVDETIVNPVTDSIDTSEPINEAPAALDALTSMANPVEATTEHETGTSESGIESTSIQAAPPSIKDNGLSRPEHSLDAASNGAENFAPRISESRAEEAVQQTAKANPDRQSKAARKASRRRNKRQAARARRNAARVEVADGRELEDSSGSIITMTAPSDPITNHDPISATVLPEQVVSLAVEESDLNSVETTGPSVEGPAAVAEPRIADIMPAGNSDHVLGDAAVDAPEAVHADAEPVPVLPLDVVIVHPLQSVQLSNDVPQGSEGGSSSESAESDGAQTAPISAQEPPTDTAVLNPAHSLESLAQSSDSDASDEGFDDVPIGILVSDLSELAAVTDIVSGVETSQLTGVEPEANSVTSITAPTIGEFSLWDEQLTFDPVDVEIAVSDVEVQPAAELRSSEPVEDVATTALDSQIIDAGERQPDPLPVESMVDAVSVREEPIEGEQTPVSEAKVIEQHATDDATEAEPSSIVEQELVENPEAFDEPLAKAVDDLQPPSEPAETDAHDEPALADQPLFEPPAVDEARPEVSESQTFVASEVTSDGVTPENQVAEPIGAAEPAPAPAPVVEPSLPLALDECKSAAELLAIGKLNQTIASYRRALELWPALNEARIGLAKVLEEKGKLADAVAACELAVAARPDDADAYCQLADAQYKDEQFAEAVAAYQTVIRFRPKNAELYYKLGNVLRDFGKLDEAKVAYRKALSLRSDFREAHNNLLDLAFRRR